MISEDVKKLYTTTIGIECHVQLKTKTKLFSAVGNDAREAEPNTLISHIDLGMPGALPVLNRHAVELAIRASFALGTEPQRFSQFDRKHYFYPDLPMGYQITQFYNPIIRDGFVMVNVDGQQKRVGIHEAHLEADAGKSIHPAGKDYSLVDLNRAGTPLLEIVSEPDMHTAAEARAYAQELYLRMKYADVSDANLYYGNMRFDVNVSVSKHPNALGTRTETKNINSFKAIERVVEFETERQIELLEKGEKIAQETRGWDEAKQKTVSQRSKEEAYDYRYMPEPDVPPIELTEAIIKPIRESMPVMPQQWRQRLQKLGVDKSQIDTLLEAASDHLDYLKIIDQKSNNPDEAKFVANWFVNVLIPITSDDGFEFNAEYLSLVDTIYQLVKANKLSSTNAKVLYAELIKTPLASWPKGVEEYASNKGYIQVSDAGEMDKIVAQVLADNAKAAEDVQNGEMKAIGFLVGQIMKHSQGKANPQMAQNLIKKHLKL